MKIAVVGSINLDMSCETERIPQKGETVFGRNLQYIPGGKGANQAVAIAKLGGTVELFGCVGNDSAGKTLIENLKTNGVETRNIKTLEDVPTGIAIITVGEKDNTIVIVAGANAHVSVDYIKSISPSLLEAQIVLLQHEIPEETIDYVVDLCDKHGITVILNPAPARNVNAETLSKISYLTPNEHEAALIFGTDDLDAILKQNPGKVVITLGAKGVATCTKDGDILMVPARKATVVDTTGAGDTLNGAFALQLANGCDIVHSLRFANVAASLSTEKYGAQNGMPDIATVLQELEALK